MNSKEDLISKKEVLEKTEISYGQFYRWKRKGLIPESWISHQSTYTGQEAFLPRERILERIEKIKELKDNHTLDEIAELLSPEVAQKSYSRESLLKIGWIENSLLEYYDELLGESDGKRTYKFADLLNLTALDRLREEDLTQEEMGLGARTLIDYSYGAKNGDDEINANLIVVRKELQGKLMIAKSKPKISFCLIVEEEPFFDPETEIIARLDVSELVREIKLKLRDSLSV